MVRVPNDPHVSKLWSNLAQELQTLGGEIGGNESHPRDVASRMCEARDEAGLNRVLTAMTIGIVLVATLANGATPPPSANIRSGLFATSSAASSRNRSGLPSA